MNKLLTHYKRLILNKTRLCTTFVYCLHRNDANYLEIGLGYESRDGLNVRHFQEDVIPFGLIRVKARALTWSGILFKKVPQDAVSLFEYDEGHFLFDGDQAQELSILLTEITKEFYPEVMDEPVKSKAAMISIGVMNERNVDLK